MPSLPSSIVKGKQLDVVKLVEEPKLEVSSSSLPNNCSNKSHTSDLFNLSLAQTKANIAISN